MPASAYASQAILTFIATTGTPNRPTAWHISLHTASPGLSGANEVTTGNDSAYTRKPGTFGNFASQEVTNTAQVDFNAAGSGANYTVTHFGVWDAASAGNFLGYGTLTNSRTVTAGQVLSAAIGALHWTLT